MAFRVICAGNLPDHVTIARFRKDFAGAVAEFFAEVLVLCARLGMGRLGTVALDGTKIAATASKAANRTEERLRKLAAEAVAAHAAADAAEDELFGEGARGDEVPEEAWSPRSPGDGADPRGAGGAGGRAGGGGGGSRRRRRRSSGSGSGPGSGPGAAGGGGGGAGGGERWPG